MRILVTGAAGFLGRHLVRRLLRQGHEVACLTRNPADLPADFRHLPAAPIDADGVGARVLCAAFRPQVAAHVAALYLQEHSFEEVGAMVEANLLLGLHVLEAMRESGCDAMVWAGSSWQHYQNAVYRPVNLYAATKQAFSTLAEYYLDTAGLKLLELHLYDSYGEDDPRPRLLNLLQTAASTGETIAMSPGEQRLHLLHVDDLASAWQRACSLVREQAPGERRVYCLPSASPISLRDLVAAFNAVDPSRPVAVAWGSRPYRNREVFEPWDGGQPLPGWRPTISLPEGLRRVRKRGAGESCPESWPMGESLHRRQEQR